jgi:uncharacterized protein (TIGR03086 family)
MTDTQDTYQRAAQGFDEAVRAVRADQWDAPSPCDQWCARDIVAHVVEGHRGVVANATGAESTPLGPDEDPIAAWEEASRAVSAIAGDPEVSATEVDGPAGKMAVGEIIGRFVAMDVLVHTWDLARSVGAPEELDEDLMRGAYADLKPVDEIIRQPGVFGPKIDPPAGADLQTEFLCFLGRRP